MNNLLIAFGLTFFAGMATAIGSIIAFTAKRTNYRFLSVSTGFSAGVMLYVSFVEILSQSLNTLIDSFGQTGGHRINAIAFFGGILVIGIIDNLVPAAENPHETHSEAETFPLHHSSYNINEQLSAQTQSFSKPADNSERKLMRMGIFTALAIGIHNFPEGLATFLTSLQEPNLGIAIAIAIALHNIPEGISVSVPIFYATGNRKKAFIYSMLSGLAEPIGAVIGYAAIVFFVSSGAGIMPPEITGIMLSSVAGIMVYISLDELLPTSQAYGKGHDSIFGLIAGMLVMAISLLMMK
jgi:zinc transporter, ZIP family